MHHNFNSMSVTIFPTFICTYIFVPYFFATNCYAFQNEATFTFSSDSINSNFNGNAQHDSELLAISGDCIEPGSNKVCSGKGQCKNDKCQCKSYQFDDANNTQTFYSYSGQYCEECPYCRGQRCRKYLPCIECKLFQKESNNCLLLCQHLAKSFKKVVKIQRNVENDDKICEIESINGCFVKFKYFSNEENDLLVEYSQEYFCSYGATILTGIFWGVIAYLVLLMILIPKLYSKAKYKTCRKSRTKSVQVENFEMY